MKKIFTLIFILTLISLNANAKQGGTLTPTSNPIVTNMSFTLNYDGTGTNFTNWTPKCFIHVWLVPKNGQTFTGNYAPNWISCNGDIEYDEIDSKYKMTHDDIANSGKYSITISNLFTYMDVLDEDKSKVDKLGVIVRAQYPGDDNQTNDFLLQVSNPTTSLISSIETMSIKTDNGALKAKFNEVSTVQLFSASGQLITSQNSVTEFNRKLKKGVYFMLVNEKSIKVIVK